jgi:hypothetical protein
MIWTAGYNGTDQPAHLPEKIRGVLVFNNPKPTPSSTPTKTIITTRATGWAAREI